MQSEPEPDEKGVVENSPAKGTGKKKQEKKASKFSCLIL